MVDNGCADQALIERLSVEVPGVKLVRPNANLGFAGGCNAGVAASAGQVVVLVNSDAIVETGCISELRDALDDDGSIGIATASVRIADTPEVINSAGNPMHLTGVAWSGGFGDGCEMHNRRKNVLSASGATMAMPRRLWEALGGFDDAMFAYLEDTEISLRTWLAGFSVVFVPEAVSLHRYEFSRSPLKMRLLERNRHRVLWTILEARTLFLLTPLLVAFEIAIHALAAVQGWLPSKLKADVDLMRSIPSIAARRRMVSAARVEPDYTIVSRMTPEFSQSVIELPAALRWSDALLRLYHRCLCRLVRR